MDWLDAITKQLNVIGQSPIPFLIVWVILTYGAYRFARHHFSERFANMETRISLRDEQIALLKDSQRGGVREDQARFSIPTASPALAAPETPLKPTTHSVQTSAGEKEFLDSSITAQSLMLLCKDKTGLQAKRLTAGYIGKWISVEGGVANVSETTYGTTYAAINAPIDGGQYSGGLVWLAFARPEPVLETLEKEEVIRAIGRIELIKELSVELEECELVV